MQNLIFAHLDQKLASIFHIVKWNSLLNPNSNHTSSMQDICRCRMNLV